MEYPLPKLDLMHEARKGMAMENWGLVLFTPRLLLLDPDTATEEDTWTVLSLLTHELAHQVKPPFHLKSESICHLFLHFSILKLFSGLVTW